MFRHQKYLEIPWDVHWHREESDRHGRLWMLMLLLVMAIVFLIGVGVTSGIM